MKITLEPLRALLHPVALLAFAAAAQAWIEGAAVRGIVTAGLGVLIAAATEAARRRVTPVDGEAGQSIVSVLLIVFLVLVILLVLFRLA